MAAAEDEVGGGGPASVAGRRRRLAAGEAELPEVELRRRMTPPNLRFR